MNRRRLLQSLALAPLAWSARALASGGQLWRAFGPGPAHGAIQRVYAAGPPASVLVYCLAPDKMLGWPYELSSAALAMLPPAQGGLPMVGRLSGRGSTLSQERLLALRPDLILDVGTVNDNYTSAAVQVAAQTGIRYILMAGDLNDSPEQLRAAGEMLDAQPRAELLASYARSILDEAAQARSRFARASSPSVYLARSSDGLETGLAGSIHGQAFSMAGARNVAHTPASSGVGRVSMEQLLAWDPDYVFTQNPAFVQHTRQSPLWMQLRAVKEKRLVLTPMLPFGWVDAPPGINRLLGLHWLIDIFNTGRPSAQTDDFIVDFFRVFYRIDAPAELLASARNAQHSP
ncbi:ABC transporter substrate-binding protein [Pusillimonas noertemannii]|uniref:ABC transporter substrate-binding protein n=1 Tax=Pusillimonas noertemannii TaxID=305977 RepID=UPI000318F589|nr:ABC transporter substrate-binding protein [Pusillimonas noertemannii]